MRKVQTDHSLKINIFRRLRKEAKKERDLLILDLLHETGINVSELCEIRVSHIKKDLLTINKTKNGLERRVKLSESISSRIQGFATEGYLFSSRQSEKITPRRVEQIVKQLSKRAGISPCITPRDLRELYVQGLLKKGLRGKELGEVLALKSIREKETPSGEDLSKLLSAVKPRRDRLLVSLMMHTAATPAEISSLEKEDITEDFVFFRGTAKLPKRAIRIPRALAKEIKSLAEPNKGRNIFCTRQSESLSPRRIEQLLVNYSEKAGLSRRITPEMIRRHVSSELLADDPDNAGEILGITRLTLFSQGSFAKMGGKGR